VVDQDEDDEAEFEERMVYQVNPTAETTFDFNVGGKCRLRDVLTL